MPQSRRALATAAAVAVALSSGCIASPGESGSALSHDGGPLIALEGLDDPPLTLAPELSVTCTAGYPLFLCEGHCLGGELCCVTGARPLGVCRSLDGCASQCAYDCAVIGDQRGPWARAICEASCIAVSPEVTCEMTHHGLSSNR